MRIITFVIALISSDAFATPAECKLSFYNFNQTHEARIQAVGVDSGSGKITLGFRHDVSPDLKEQSDMASLMRLCMATGMMSPMLYKFKRSSTQPHTLCTNFNRITLGMVCSKYKCEGPNGKPCKALRLVKGDKDGKPVEIHK